MALEEYDKLRDAGVRPSRVAFINVVKVLGHAQLFDVAFDLLIEETRSDVERRLESKRKFGGQWDDRGFVTSLEAWNEYILSFAGFGGVGGVGGGGRLQVSVEVIFQRGRHILTLGSLHHHTAALGCL